MFRAAYLALLTAVVLGVAPAPLAARQASEPQESQEDIVARLEALRPQLAEARAAAEAARDRQARERARADHPPADTIQVEGLSVVAPPDQIGLAEELFSEVWSEEFANITGSPSLAQRYFVFQWRVSPEPIHMAGEAEGGAPVTRVEVYRLTDRTRNMVRRRVRLGIADALLQDLPDDAPIRRWLNRGLGGQLSRSAAYREVAMLAGESGVHQACLDQDPAACWAAVGLGFDGSLTTLGRWFAPEERREMATLGMQLSPYFDDFFPLEPGTRAHECRYGEVQEACDVFLQENFGWPRLQPRAVGPAMYWTLFWHAVSTGGEGAWQRALSDAGSPPAEMLIRVAAMRSDELAASWRAELETDRPQLYADLSTGRWAVLFWILVFAGLAMRSTRWRTA